MQKIKKPKKPKLPQQTKMLLTPAAKLPKKKVRLKFE